MCIYRRLKNAVVNDADMTKSELYRLSVHRVYVTASLLVQAGSNYESKNRFGETPASIMDTGNAGKRINLFSKEGIPSLSELERMEAEHKERGMSIPAVSAAAAKQVSMHFMLYGRSVCV